MQRSYSLGPCVAKRKEAQRDEAVDFVMTFEEVFFYFRCFRSQLGDCTAIRHGILICSRSAWVCTSRRRDGSRKGIPENGSGQNQCHTGIRFKQEEYRNITCIRKIGKSSRTVHRSDGLRGGVSQDPVLIAAVTGNVSWYKNWLNRKRRIKSRKLP